MLIGIDDEIEILIPVNSREWDGFLFSPCIEESGISKIADMENEVDEFGLMVIHDEQDELLYGKKDVFMLCPHGFSEPKEENTPAELN